MITTHTVLVLGAGASLEYGFPSGRILLTNLVGSLRHETSGYFKILEECGFKADDIREFRKALDLCGLPSVDAFLEGRPALVPVGKAAIALDLIPAESEEGFSRHAGNQCWYEYLFSRVNAPPSDFKKNMLSVITFNYDKSFEHFLFLALKHSHDLSDDRSAELVRSIPIIHLHGHLGELPHLTGQGRPYKPTLSSAIVMESSRTIKIIHESTDADAEFVMARKLLEQAETICFLGFGYHRTNVDRLGLSTMPLIRTKRLFGTAYKMPHGERTHVTTLIGQGVITLGTEDQDVLSFLRYHAILGW